MSEKKNTLPRGMLLVAFGVILYSVLQNLGPLMGTVGHLWGIVNPIVLGLCMAFVLNVLMNGCENFVMRLYRLYLRKKTGLKSAKTAAKPGFLRGASLLLTLLLAVSIIALTLVVIIPNVSEAFTMFVSNLEQSSAQLSTILGDLFMRFGIDNEAVANMQATIKNLSEEALDWIGNQRTAIAGYAINVTSSLFGTVVDVLFGLIIAIYTLLDKERIGRFTLAVCRRFLPENICAQTVRIGKLSYTTFSNFVRGQFLEATVLGLLCFVGMLLLRLPYAAAISLLIGVTALIPVVGAWIGGAVSALLVLLVSPVKALVLIVFILVLQQLEGNLIYPRVVGSSIGLPGILVLCAFIIGQGLFGIAGILICVPMTAVLFTILKEAVYTEKS